MWLDTGILVITLGLVVGALLLLLVEGLLVGTLTPHDPPKDRDLLLGHLPDEQQLEGEHLRETHRVINRDMLRVVRRRGENSTMQVEGFNKTN